MLASFNHFKTPYIFVLNLFLLFIHTSWYPMCFIASIYFNFKFHFWYSKYFILNTASIYSLRILMLWIFWFPFSFTISVILFLTHTLLVKDNNSCSHVERKYIYIIFFNSNSTAANIRWLMKSSVTSKTLCWT